MPKPRAPEKARDAPVRSAGRFVMVRDDEAMDRRIKQREAARVRDT